MEDVVDQLIYRLDKDVDSIKAVFYNVIIATLALTGCYGAQCTVYKVKYYEYRITEGVCLIITLSSVPEMLHT